MKSQSPLLLIPYLWPHVDGPLVSRGHLGANPVILPSFPCLKGSDKQGQAQSGLLARWLWSWLITAIFSVSWAHTYFRSSLLLCLRAKRAFCGSLQASWVAQTVKNPLLCGRPGFDPWVGKSPGEGNRLPTPVFLPGESCGYSLAGYSPWDHEELDRTECLSHICPFTWECRSRKGPVSLAYFCPTSQRKWRNSSGYWLTDGSHLPFSCTHHTPQPVFAVGRSRQLVLTSKLMVIQLFTNSFSSPVTGKE